MKKKILLAASILFFAQELIGQTNVFPSSGNVGIGTASPYQKLSVIDGQIYLGTTTSNAVESGRIRFTEFSTGIYQGAYIHYDGRANKLYLGVHDDYGSDVSGDFNAITINRGNGYVGIGTVFPDARLAVRGEIHTQEVKVDLDDSVAPPDYVFDEEYELASLEEVEAFIQEYKHLPEIPSAREMLDEGILLKEMNLKLLKKIEELTLHLIDKDKRIKKLESKVTSLEDLESRVKELELYKN